MQVRVERLVAGGDGLARLPGGKILFLPGTAPGDLVEAEVDVEKSGYGRGRVVRVLEPGPGRRSPPCAHAASCGGCPWLHMEAGTQLAARREVLHDALRRTAGLDWRGPVGLHPSPEAGHRDRVRWKVDVGSRTVRLGYHRSRSHSVVEVGSCLLLPDGTAQRVQAAREALSTDPEAVRGLEEIVHDVAGPARDLLTLRFPRSGPPDFERLRSLAQTLLGAADLGGVAALPRGARAPVPLAGEPSLERRAGGFRYVVHGGVFFQTNAPLREEFLETVAGIAGEGGLCLDLYCGVGFLSLPLARRYREVWGIESGTEAVRLAAHNAARNGLANVRFTEALAEDWLEAAEKPRADLVVADPPRDGLGLPVARRLASLGQERTLLVACDPVSLARDLGPFLETGYDLRRLELFDFFPGTPHFETLALLMK